LRETALDGYSYAVRKFFWQRWALILMLVSRLVIGELGHATSIGGDAHLGDASAVNHHQMAGTADVAACPDHDGHEPAQAVDAPVETSCHAAVEPVSGEQDCCKSGDCQCPCLHVPCAALDALVLNPVASTLLRTPWSAEGVVSRRPSGLFRPPA
jgi:hypothetical protein